jgi:hypothetical protein
MKQPDGIQPGGAQRLRNAMRSVAGLRAVIRQTARGWVIELSDGRRCAFGRELRRSEDELLAAAVQWARRHGAASIDITT